MTATLPVVVVFDERINLAGSVIGYREHHTPIAGLVRSLLISARVARSLGDRRLAAEYLARANRERRRFADRVTPAPPRPGDELLPAGYRWYWSPMFREWGIAPTS